MVASDDTIVRIYNAMIRSLPPEKLDDMIMELQDIPGNKSFRETMKKLMDLHEQIKREGGS